MNLHLSPLTNTNRTRIIICKIFTKLGGRQNTFLQILKKYPLRPSHLSRVFKGDLFLYPAVDELAIRLPHSTGSIFSNFLRSLDGVEFLKYFDNFPEVG